MAGTDSPAEPPLVLSADIPPGAERVTGRFGLRYNGMTIPIEVTVPAGPATHTELLPILYGLCNASIARATTQSIGNGRAISCAAGCAACCRQAVPVTPTEARRLAALVAAMPDARRAAVEARFAGAKARLAQAGIDRSPKAVDMTDMNARLIVANAYFGAKVACPFLEAENCSIHPARPLACREYLVTSPPEMCAARTADVDMVTLDIGVLNRLIEVEARREGTGRLLLVDALDWVAANPAPPATVAGPALPAMVAGPALPAMVAGPALPAMVAGPALPAMVAGPALPATVAGPALLMELVASLFNRPKD
jgi:Fe-S-cluster containining protein